MNTMAKIILTIVLLMAAPHWTIAQIPVGPEFTYQGQLQDNGQAANGNYDFSFTLFDSLVGGTQIGPTVELLGLPVVDGRFTVDLDFGAGAFDGDQRWLEIEVDLVTLDPRQKITATPYATYSSNTRGLFVSPSGDVGIGTDTPERVLHTVGDAILVERDVNDAGVVMRNTLDGELNGFIGVRNTGTNQGHLLITDEQQNSLMFLKDGQVGIGTPDPEADLHVQDGSAGNVTVGNNTSAVFERSSTNYIHIISPSNTQRGIQFGDPQNVGDGSIIYNNAFLPDGMQFRTGGNNISMVIDAFGYVGIGRDTGVTTESWFDVQTPAGNNSFGGMHIATDGEGGIPFYGYAAGGTTDCYHYYNGGVDKWGLRLGISDNITVDGATGRVGISQPNPAFLLDVNGSAHVATNLEVGINACKPGGGTWATCSDRRYKKNIDDLAGSLEKLLKLRGVTFEYKDPESINELPGQRVGMIAQEVEQVFPEWVIEKQDGYKMISTSGFEALTVEALRELREEKDAQIAELQAEKDAEILALQDENDALRNRLAALEAAVANLTAN